jgi:Restriction endonuclease S subunits
MKEVIEHKNLLQAKQVWRSSIYKEYRYREFSVLNTLRKIPHRWKFVRLKNIFRVFSGATPKSNENSYWDGDISWVTPEDLGNLSVNSASPLLKKVKSTQRTITEKGYQSCSATIVPKGSLILSTRAPIGHIAVADIELCTNQGCRSLVFREKGNVHYMYYQLLTMQSELQSRGQGSTFLELSKTNLENISIIVPPLYEQQDIASFLDRETEKINALIAKRERMIELLQERRVAIINQAVTKGLNPDVKMKDLGLEWLGKIPEHWEVRRVKNVAMILRGKFSHRPRNDPRFYDGSHPFIQTGDITSVGKYIKTYQQTLNELGYQISKEFPSQTLVMAIAANVGDVAILQFSACFPDSIVGFVPHQNTFLDYLYYCFLTMKQEMLSTATINTQLNLNIERIGGLYSPYPPIEEQQAIANYLDQETTKIDKLITGIQQSIEKLKEYSTALISAAVTGKIDVRGEVDAVNVGHAERVADVAE